VERDGLGIARIACRTPLLQGDGATVTSRSYDQIRSIEDNEQRLGSLRDAGQHEKNTAG